MKPEDMNKADFFTSIFLFLLGLIVFIISIRMPTFRELGANPYSAPGIVPMILGVIIVIMGAILFTRSVISKGYKISLSFQGLKLFFKNNSIKRLFIALFLSVFYVILLGKINYFLLTTLYIFLFVWSFELKTKKTLFFALLEAVLIAACISYVFRYLFLVTLP
ncbi:MAG: hypothetical protein DRH33_03765 [Candidatus Nealsonbacteria bacterium]|nr:MAG: hypothetical protein DRH33_03765 [Candidatus Nealsonbacteria bacterium]